MIMNFDAFANSGTEIREIPVRISYEIIQLFSEGLYQSPNKAIEELVCNSYDANAERVHILLPEPPEGSTSIDAPLWVIDDGYGMDEEGFRRLWSIAYSEKSNADPSNGRAPIGQFGIGKLAAYVLARRLTHISRVNGRLLMTSMDFNAVTGHQFEDSSPVPVSLREVDEQTAQGYLAEIKARDRNAWDLMFHKTKKSETWTAAALSDFKDLYQRLRSGRLRWVLSSGLPLVSNFEMWLDGDRVESSKVNLQPIKTVSIGEDLPDIGRIDGTASIFAKRLTEGKSDQLGRSHGFFVRVRERVINLEDELFGVDALNHAAWSRFSLEVAADGLRNHLLSSREGVRDSDAIRAFRDVLKNAFNECRTAYEAWARRQNQEIDIERLLAEAPSTHVTDPLINRVLRVLETQAESFYIETAPRPDNDHPSEWLSSFEDDVRKQPFTNPKFSDEGADAPALRYRPDTRGLFVNRNHPFVDKLTFGGKQQTLAKLFAYSELLLECQLEDNGVNRPAIAGLLENRDRLLRIISGYGETTASEVIRSLSVAKQNSDALEVAVGKAFQALGFDYERKGGNDSGPDGVLYARLGRHGDTVADYTLVYDTKQTNHPSVPADKISISGMEDFRTQWHADFGFFAATAYDAENNENGKINRQIIDNPNCKVTLLKVDHLNKLVRWHYRHGVTLTQLRSLFENAHTVFEVDEWLGNFECQLLEEGEIPLELLLEGLEAEKGDLLAPPSIAVVRSKTPALTKFRPDRLTARLKAMQQIIGHRWIEVEENSQTVKMHQTADQILTQLERNARDLAALDDSIS